MRISRFLAAGLFVVAAVVVVEAQPGGGGFFNNPNFIYTSVLNNKALQEELKITDEQKEKFKGIAEKNTEATKKVGESFKEKFADAGMDKDKLKDIFTEFQKEMSKAGEGTKKGVLEVLTDDQKKRLKQIERQFLGVRAFQNEEIAKDLSLTDEQKSKIKGIVSEYGKDTAEVNKGFKFGDKERMAENQKKIAKLTKAAMGDIDDVLTADQRKMWKDMTGEAFDTSKLFQFNFGPPKGKTKD
jgi:Spy/CpxP family protein refolding chaperone